ncbi:MAG TPA: Dabb family protein [Ilumatobacteraceae bacterium]
MITHVATFRWKPETTVEQIAAISAALATLPALIPSVRTYHYGADLALVGAANMDYAVVATFDSIEDWRAYDSNADHEQLRADLIRPWVAERAAVQFQS